MFCQNCGNKLKRTKENLLVCTACGYHHYINPRLTNGVIFYNDKNEILLVKRKYEPQKGKWDIPGGFVDTKETLEESLAREVHEEIGITVHPEAFTYIGSQWDRYEYQGENYYTVPTFFIAKFPEGQTLKLSSDVSGARWFKKDKIPFDDLAFESLRKALRLIQL